MALRTQQARDGTRRFELLPNRSSSWAQTRRFLMVIALLNGLIALLFAWQGLWLVLPFSGLEVAALAAGLYCCSRATYRRELILVEGDRIVVWRGSDRVDCCEEFVRAWAKVQWQPLCDRGRSRLLLGSHGRFVEIGAFLVETERRQLAGELGRLLGQPLGARAPELALDAGLNREMGL